MVNCSNLIIPDQITDNEPGNGQDKLIDRHVDRLTDSVNMISNIRTTPWHWYSVQGLLK